MRCTIITQDTEVSLEKGMVNNGQVLHGSMYGGQEKSRIQIKDAASGNKAIRALLHQQYFLLRLERLTLNLYQIGT